MNKFTIGSTVYFKLKPETAGMITGILQRANGKIYLVTWSNDLTERYHAEIELTDEKTFQQ